MFIPTWIIVIGVIWFIIYLNKREKRVISNVAIEENNDDSSSGLSKLSKYWEHESDMSNLELNQAKTILEKHINEVSKIKIDPNKVKREREKLDDDLKFSERLWQFIQDVKYYPHWRENQKKVDGKKWWKSETINPEELIINKYDKSGLKKLIDDKFADSNEILEFKFELEGKKYHLYANRELLNKDSYMSHDSRLVYYFPVFIFEGNEKLVFQALLNYEIDGDLDYYDRSQLEAFKPGEWTLHLLNVMYKIRKEEEKHHKEVMDEINSKIEKDNKEKFVD